MYEPETILKLKEPRSKGTPPVGKPQRGKEGEIGYRPQSADYEPPSDDWEVFPYDRVRVIGQSPINHASITDEWSGTSGQGVIVEPIHEFGATLDEPYGKLQRLYEVESVPVHEVPAEVPIRVINSTSGSAGPTPEEQIAEKAPGVPPKPGEKRGRTKHSPLDDLPGAEAESSSPLGDVEPPKTEE